MTEENSQPIPLRETDQNGEENSANTIPAEASQAHLSDRKTGLFSDLITNFQRLFRPGKKGETSQNSFSISERNRANKIYPISPDGTQPEIADELINQRLGNTINQEATISFNKTIRSEKSPIFIDKDENGLTSETVEEIGLIGEKEINTNPSMSTPNIDDEISTWARVNLPYEDDFQFWKERSLILDDQSQDEPSTAPTPFLEQDSLALNSNANTESTLEGEKLERKLEGEDEDYWQSFLSGVKSNQKDNIESISEDTSSAGLDETPIKMGKADYWQSISSSLKYDEGIASSDAFEKDNEDLELEERLRQSLFSPPQDTTQPRPGFSTPQDEAFSENNQHPKDISSLDETLKKDEPITPSLADSNQGLKYDWSNFEGTEPSFKQGVDLIPFSSEEKSTGYSLEREDDSYPFITPISELDFEGTEKEISEQIQKDTQIRIQDRLYDPKKPVDFEDIRPEVLEGYEPNEISPSIPFFEKPEPVRRGLLQWFKGISTLNKILIIFTALAIPTLLLVASLGIGLFAFDSMSNTSIISTEQPLLVPGTSYPIGIKMTGGWYFPLQIGKVVKGTWNPLSAEWLEGTELRKVIGIPWSRQTEAVVLSLKPGDKIELIMSNGDSLFYNVQYPGEVPVTDNSIYKDTKPSLVIILFKENAKTRWVVVCKQ